MDARQSGDGDADPGRAEDIVVIAAPQHQVRTLVQPAPQGGVLGVAHHHQHGVAVEGQAQPGQAAPGRRRGEHVLEQLGQRLRALAAQGLALVAGHGDLQGGHGGDVLDHRQPGGAGAFAFERHQEARRTSGGGHGQDEADHAEITAVAASHVTYDLVSLLALGEKP